MWIILRKTRRPLAVMSCLLLLAGFSVPPLRGQDQPDEEEIRIVAYRSFRPKFHHESETFSLVASFYLVNVGLRTLKDVTFRQPFPPELTLVAVGDDLRSQPANRAGFWEKVEENTYILHEPEIRRRGGATMLAELNLSRRTDLLTLPPLEFDYTSSVGNGTERTMEMTLDVGSYANHVGDLDRFLRKFADISMDVSVTGRDDWEFYPRAAVAVGRNPEGIIGIETQDEGYTGHFRIHSGAPGDALDILVKWKQTWKDDALQEEDAVQNRLSEYLKWMGPFKFDSESIQISKEKFNKYKAWVLTGRWIDTVPNQLGSGPIKALVFFSPREDVEYYLLFRAHGRAVGPESKNPAPEKEEALMALQEKVLKTFRSEISPISYNR